MAAARGKIPISAPSDANKTSSNINDVLSHPGIRLQQQHQHQRRRRSRAKVGGGGRPPAVAAMTLATAILLRSTVARTAGVHGFVQSTASAAARTRTASRAAAGSGASAAPYAAFVPFSTTAAQFARPSSSSSSAELRQQPAPSTSSSATTAGKKRRMAEFDSLFFDTTDAADATAMGSARLPIPAQPVAPAPASILPKKDGGGRRAFPNADRSVPRAAATATVPAAAATAGGGDDAAAASAAAAAVAEPSSVGSSSTAAAAKRAFPAPRSPVPSAASAAAMDAGIGSKPRAGGLAQQDNWEPSSDGPAYAQQQRRQQPQSRHAQPGRSGGQTQTQTQRQMPPPMEYDYEYYDDEMGVSGSFGEPMRGDHGDGAGDAFVAEYGDEYGDYVPSVIDFGATTTTADADAPPATKEVNANGQDILDGNCSDRDSESPPSLQPTAEAAVITGGGDSGEYGLAPGKESKVDSQSDSPLEASSSSNIVTSDAPPPPVETIPSPSSSAEAPSSDRPPSDSRALFPDLIDGSTAPASQPKTVVRSTSLDTTAEPHTLDFMSQSSNGNGKTTRIDILTAQLESITNDVYASNDGREFNINSPKQVADVLFGEPPATADGGHTGERPSTNKDVLDAMASAGNQMADLILRYRQCQRDLKKATKRVENKENGIHVDDFHKPNSQIGTNNANTNGKAGGVTASSVSSVKKQTQIEKEDELFHDPARNPLLLVDASAYIFRAYYSMPPLHRSDGTPVGAVMGFCNMLNRLVLNRLLSGGRPRIVLVFDAKGDNFRKDIFPEYKANRPPCPVDLVPQFDLIREAADAYGIDQIEASSYEADDVIATLSTIALQEGIDVNILSGDKDLMQLVTEPDAVPSVHMIDPMKMIRVSHEVVVSKWGVPPSKLGDVLALAGDSSDNIPGVPGIGPKIASTLISEYGSLESLLERAEEVKQKGRREKIIQNTDKARLSRKLVELISSIPVEKMTMPENFESVSELRMEELSGDRLLDFYGRMGFRDLTRKLERRLSNRNGNMRQGNSEVGDDIQGAVRDSTLTSSSEITLDGPNTMPRARASSGLDPEIDSNNPDAPGPMPSTSPGLNDDIRQGLLLHRRRNVEPPKAEDYQDVPF